MSVKEPQKKREKKKIEDRQIPFCSQNICSGIKRMNAGAKQKLVWNILEWHNVTLTPQCLIPFPKINGIKKRKKD